MDSALFIGIVGMVFILLAFAFNQFELWKTDDLTYDLANFIGGAMLTYYAFVGNALPFLILNGIWTIVSLRDIIQDVQDLQHGNNHFKWIHHRRKNHRS